MGNKKNHWRVIWKVGRPNAKGRRVTENRDFKKKDEALAFKATINQKNQPEIVYMSYL
jgi:hypothetical protein